jgi:hypothetical protein
VHFFENVGTHRNIARKRRIYIVNEIDARQDNEYHHEVKNNDHRVLYHVGEVKAITHPDKAKPRLCSSLGRYG